jgi:hypothetical protein
MYSLIRRYVAEVGLGYSYGVWDVQEGVLGVDWTACQQLM